VLAGTLPRTPKMLRMIPRNSLPANSLPRADQFLELAEDE
jgi:hypothetical protein